MSRPKVSIVIPHYQTADLARLCLRAIRRWTRDVPYEVIVVDNRSTDGESLDYLRSVEWIRLIERQDEVGPVALGHKEAVDIGFAAARAPHVLAFHTDTIPIRSDWLAWHVAQIERSPSMAAVGTYKLELKSPLQTAMKVAEPLLSFRRRGRTSGGDHEPYIRSHCALYRKAVLDRLGLRYVDPEGDVAGRSLHYGLIAHGYEVALLDVRETLKRVVHLNHGTMVIRPELGARRRTIRRGLRRIDRFLRRPEVQELLQDSTLDRGTHADVPHAA